MLGDASNVTSFRQSFAYRTASLASAHGKPNKRSPSYLSARSFSDGIIEVLRGVHLAGDQATTTIDRLPPGPLKDYLIALNAEAQGDVTKIKAGLESWFDDTMDRLQGAYK